MSVNSSNMSGAMDIIVVQDELGKLWTTDFHLWVGKSKALYP